MFTTVSMEYMFFTHRILFSDVTTDIFTMSRFLTPAGICIVIFEYLTTSSILKDMIRKTFIPGKMVISARLSDKFRTVLSGVSISLFSSENYLS